MCNTSFDIVFCIFEKCRYCIYKTCIGYVERKIGNKLIYSALV